MFFIYSITVTAGSVSQLDRLRGAEITGRTLLLGVSVRVSPAEISI